jgi:hypothetical protein
VLIVGRGGSSERRERSSATGKPSKRSRTACRLHSVARRKTPALAGQIDWLRLAFQVGGAAICASVRRRWRSHRQRSMSS